ncbi:MAG: M1 family metallopeptidase [Candidatus Nomurabacteria bacterium]|jgi:aminopeptidase N|nr:M1 family metallopeptidase [Candidatus Nomurabacteria bacterium]
MTKSVSQLHQIFSPEHYDLILDIAPNGETFSGRVKIVGQRKSAEPIHLHSLNLEIQSALIDGVPASVESAPHQEIILTNGTANSSVAPQDDKTSGETLSSDSSFGEHFFLREKGSAKPRDDGRDKRSPEVGADDNGDQGNQTVVELTFSGQIIAGAMRGLYPSFYEAGGRREKLLATQFESHFAREVFPCVDEPAAKATFSLSIVSAPGDTVLGNMPVARQTVENGRLKTEFDKTPKMSTYLLAFAVGQNLIKKSGQTARGVKVNVYAAPSQPADSLDFALDVATRCIDFYEKYFGVDYPLPKSDHLALPDFSAGAMENWGLITYREEALLARPNAAASQRRYIATDVAHELAHQWFGNLVTMRWWNDLWLNESFASLMESLVPDRLWPSWKIWQDFETGCAISALRRDALPGVQPIRQDVSDPEAIDSLFDPSIVYAKGEFLLRMMFNLLDEKDFRAGLKNYFQKHKYSNTVADDLWQALSDASGQDVGSLMTPWLSQPGYPLVSADLTIDGEIILRQTRFLTETKNPENPAPTGQRSLGKANAADDDSIWPIPLFASDPNAPKIFSTKEIKFKPADLPNFRLNVGGFGYYIYQFSEKLRAKIGWKISDLDVDNRLAELNQTMLLARGGRISETAVIDALENLSDETEPAVWDVMALALNELKQFVDLNSPEEAALKKFSGDLARPLSQKLGFTRQPGDDAQTHILRANLLARRLYANDPAAIEFARQTYSEHKKSLAQIDAQIRPAILSDIVLRDPGEFDFLLDQYKLSQDSELKGDLLAALTQAAQPEQIDRLLDQLSQIDVIKPQETARCFVYLLRNRRARAKTWTWLTENWNFIEKTFGGDASFDNFPRYAGSTLSTAAELKNYREFFAPLSQNPALKLAISVGARDIAARVRWIERNQAGIREKLIIS